MTRLLTPRSPVSSRVKPRGQSAARTLQVADHPQGTQLGEEPPATGPAPCPHLPAFFVPGPAPYPRLPACFASGATQRTRCGVLGCGGGGGGGERAGLGGRCGHPGADPAPGSLQVASGSPERSLGARLEPQEVSQLPRGACGRGRPGRRCGASGPGQDPSFPSCFLIGKKGQVCD